MKTERLGIEVYGPRTFSNGSRCDESTLYHDAGSLLSRDTGDRGALQELVESSQELEPIHTETRSVCESMVTDVVVPIGLEEVVVEVVLSHFAFGCCSSGSRDSLFCSNGA
jgi:hypothetical protein